MTHIQTVPLRGCQYSFTLALLGVCFILLTGCGPAKNPRAIHLVLGKGLITVDGKPLVGATITFIPTEDNQFATQSVALSDIKGNFSATTFNSGDGIHPGNYLVTVDCVETISHVSDEEIARAEASGVPISIKTTIRSLIPTRYNSSETSGLTIEIPPKGNQKISIILESE